MSQKQNIIWRLYISEFFGELIPIYAIFPIMFVERSGISAAGVGMLLAIWQLVNLAADVPTGIFADRFPRKYALILGKLLRILTYPIWLLVPNFGGYLLGFVALGLGDAFLSGALEAYTYDELKDRALFNRTRQRTVSIHLAAFGISGLAAVIIGPRYRELLVLSTISSVIALLAGIALPKDRHTSLHTITIRKLARVSASVLHPSKRLFKPFMSASIAMGLMIICVEYLSTFYKSSGISTRLVTILIVGGNLLTFIILWTKHRYENWMNHWRVVLLIGFVASIVASVYGGLSFWIQAPLLFLFVRVVRITSVDFSNELQHVAESKVRATTSSLSTMTAKALGAAGISLIGVLSHSGDIRLSMSAVLVVLSVLLVAFHLRPARTHV